MQSTSQCGSASCMVVLNRWDASVATEIEREASEMMEFLNQAGIAKNEVLRMTLVAMEACRERYGGECILLDDDVS